MKRQLQHERGREWSGRPELLTLVVLALSWCLVATVSAAQSSHLLDGKVFVGKNGEKGRELAEYEDEKIIFQNGLFTSVSCEPYDFSSSPYLAQLIDNKIQFEAVTASPTHGTIRWQGIIDGDRADVTFVWTKKRWYWDIRREYWFHGTLNP